MKKTNLALFYLILSFLTPFGSAFCTEQIYLDGTWQFQIDRNDEGVKAGWLQRICLKPFNFRVPCRRT